MTATHDWVQRGTVRAELEAAEARTLAPWSAKAAESAGRGQAEPEDPVRTCWMRDLDRITFSRAMLRAHGKTQSFIPAFSGEGPAAGRQGGPYIGDHVTRATHMQQTARIVATIAQALPQRAPGHRHRHRPRPRPRLLRPRRRGRPPAGRPRRLRPRQPGGAPALTLLEPRTLTAEVLEGIASPLLEARAALDPEGLCARLADRIAYLTADLTDALRAGASFMASSSRPRSARSQSSPPT